MNEDVTDDLQPTEVLDVEVEAYQAVAAEPEAANKPEPDMEALIAEAEQRGYLRGRNEAIAERMNAPALLQNPARVAADSVNKPVAADEDAMTALFLTGLRPGVWD